MSPLYNSIITLRALEPNDIEQVFTWENDRSIWKYGTTIAPYSLDMIEHYILNYEPDIYKTKQLRFIISRNEDKASLGMIDLFDFDPFNSRAEAGIVIAEEYRRNGYAEIALKLLVEYAKEYLNIKQLYSIVSADNEPSISLFTKLGFSESSRLKCWVRTESEYHDAVIMQNIFK